MLAVFLFQPIDEVYIVLHRLFSAFAFLGRPGVMLGDGLKIKSTRAIADDIALRGLFKQSVDSKQFFVGGPLRELA